MKDAGDDELLAANRTEAIKQCRDRNYAAAFSGDPRPVYYVGVNYNPAEGVRTTDDVACEKA